MIDDIKNIQFEPEFEKEWENAKVTLKTPLLQDEFCKPLCYGFYLIGREVASKAFIKQLRENGHV